MTNCIGKKRQFHWKTYSCLLMFGLLMLVFCGCGAKDNSLREGVLYPMYEMTDDGEKWGYIDSNGEYVIEPAYQTAGVFTDNSLAAVETEDASGYINTSGEWEITADHDYIGYFCNGYAIVGEREWWNPDGDGVVGSKMVAQFGFIDTKGTEVVPLQYYSAYPYNGDGKFLVQVEDSTLEDEYISEDLWTYISLDGIESDYFPMTRENEIEQWDFSDGPMKVYEDNTAGFVDQNGEYVIDRSENFNRSGSEFSNGMCPVLEDYEGEGDRKGYTGYLYGFMDDKGQLKTEKKYFCFEDEQPGFFYEGYALVRTLPDENGLVSYGYIDKTGNWVLKKTYDKKIEKGN